MKRVETFNYCQLVGKRQSIQPGESYCTQCYTPKPTHTGFWQQFNNGKNRMWICADCARKGVR